MILPVLKMKLFIFVVLCVVVGGATLLISKVGEQGAMSVISTITGLAALAWVVMSGEKWWLITPVSVAFGGTLLIEYKFYPHEMSLVLCILALIPLLALRTRLRPVRPPLSSSAYILLLLFVFNWILSFYNLNDSADIGDVGSLSRVYMHGLWALIFGILFYRYGRIDPALLLKVIYITFFIRAILGALAVLFQDIIPIPKIGFVFSGVALGLIDYRVTGIQLGLLAFAHASLATHAVVKRFHYAVIIASVVVAVLGGGRVTVVMMCTIPLLWALLRRRFGVVALCAAAVISLVLVLNRYPDILYRLPEEMRRALSILVSESSTRWLDWHELNRLSNIWHQRLGEIGFERWSSSPVTFILGNRVEPYSDLYNAYSATLEMRADVAAKLGQYESGLWTMLGVMGIVGFLTYTRLFIFLLKKPLQIFQRDGIASPVHALSFLAVIGIGIWLCFSWIAGGFPSYELMLAFLAKAAYDDMLASEKEVPHAHPD